MATRHMRMNQADTCVPRHMVQTPSLAPVTHAEVPCRWYSVGELLDPRADYSLGRSAVICAVRLPAARPDQHFWSGKVL